MALLLEAVTSLILMCWGWICIRGETHMGWGAIAFVGGIIGWMYSLNQIVKVW